MKKLFSISTIILTVFPLISQNIFEIPTSVREDGASPDQSAVFDIQSTSKGVLIPRMTENNRIEITMPASGLLIYQVDEEVGFYFNSGTSSLPNWQHLSRDADSDPNNEIETWSTLTGIPADFSDNIDNIDDADNDPTNELELPQNGEFGQVLISHLNGTYQWDHLGKIVDQDGDSQVIAQHGFGSSKDAIQFQLEGALALTIRKEGRSHKIHTFPSAIVPNLYFGANAGLNDTSGYNNIGIGTSALKSINNGLDGQGNIAVGTNAFENLSGTNFQALSNIAIGTFSGSSLMDGYSNTFLGASSGSSLVARSDFNVFVGSGAGHRLTRGFNNVVLGSNSNFSGAPPKFTQSGAVKLGHDAGLNDSTNNVLHIANSHTKSLISGDFSKDSLAINGSLRLNGNTDLSSWTLGITGESIMREAKIHLYEKANPTDLTDQGITYHDNAATHNWTTMYGSAQDFDIAFDGILKAYVEDVDGSYNIASDRRLKTDFKDMHPVLPRVMKLKPTKYRYKSSTSKHQTIGFIAQEVEPLFPELISQKDRVKGLAITNMTVIAIKAIQEQQQIIEVLQSKINYLSEQLSSLKR